jgi:tRNA(Ile)-lysidine synthase
MLTILSRWLTTHITPGASLVVAYSGGQDSHVLLHALSQLHQQNPIFTLRAIHINHGLQAKAQVWEQHCQKVCDELQIPLTIKHLHLKIPAGESLENVARQARYAAFSEILQPAEILMTAHMVEDQAETFMLQLLRGSGPLGLGSIAPKQTLGKGFLARPLLKVPKSYIQMRAQQYQLQWIEDDSNVDLRFRRNFLRHSIFPLLEQASPGFAACIARSAQHCAQTQALLETFLATALDSFTGDFPHSLKTDFLKTDPLQQPYLLRYWLKKEGVLLPSTKKLQVILDQMTHAAPDAQPCLQWGDVELRRYQEHLILRKIPQRTTPQPLITWSLTTPLLLPNGQQWAAKKMLGQGIDCTKLAQPCLEVAFRQGGERCRRAGDVGSRSLKKYLQEHGIPQWERVAIPLLYQSQALVGVGDLFICEGWQVSDPNQQGWVLERVD